MEHFSYDLSLTTNPMQDKLPFLPETYTPPFC